MPAGCLCQTKEKSNESQKQVQILSHEAGILKEIKLTLLCWTGETNGESSVEAALKTLTAAGRTRFRLRKNTSHFHGYWELQHVHMTLDIDIVTYEALLARRQKEQAVFALPNFLVQIQRKAL